MDVQVERRSEALDRGHRSATPASDAAALGSAALERQERPDEDAEHGATELVVPGERVAEPVRKRQDPLPHGQAAENVVGRVSCQVRHPAHAA